MYETNYNKNKGNNNGGNKQKSIGAIWKSVAKNGADYFKIKIGDKYYVAFVNNYKQDPKSPEFYIYETQQVNRNTGNTSSNNYEAQEKANNTGYNDSADDNRYASKDTSRYATKPSYGGNRYRSNQGTSTQESSRNRYASESNPSQMNTSNDIERTNEEIDDIPSLSF